MDEGDASAIARERAPARAGAGRRPDPPVGAGLFAAGGILGALAAASCCIVPLVLFGAGVSTAWIGNLGALAPYQPAFVALTLLFLAGGFWFVYRRPGMAAAEGSACAGRRSQARGQGGALGCECVGGGGDRVPLRCPGDVGGLMDAGGFGA